MQYIVSLILVLSVSLVLSENVGYANLTQSEFEKRGLQDFCAGKSNGYWCSSTSVLSLCYGGSVSSTSSCGCGCTSMPAGYDDKCASCTTNFCSGKSNGKWCKDSSTLVNCNNGAISSSESCGCGCETMSAGTADRCKSCTTPGTGFRLPFRKSGVRINQGWNGGFSHVGDQAYAYDFDLSEGTPVYAVASGVAYAKNPSTVCTSCDTSACVSNARVVSVKHPDGTTTTYWHLSSTAVTNGQQVSSDTVIGYSGNTGWSCGAHLHFQRFNTGSGTHWGNSIPVYFPGSGYDRQLQYGEYVSG